MTELRHYAGIGKDGSDIEFTCASGPVILEDGKVLLNKHGEDEFWKFPGGAIHDEFSLESNAKREVLEELNIEVEIIDENPCFLIFEREHNGVKEYVFLVHYLAKIVGDREIIKGSDVREYSWIDINQLPDDIAPNIRPVLEWFKKSS
jgi:ADP-ribose pyrophosphatase YjhB (NUDIX family)